MSTFIQDIAGFFLYTFSNPSGEYAAAIAPNHMYAYLGVACAFILGNMGAYSAM